MNSILRNILALIAGCILGSAVNMGIILISDSIIPAPEGADMTTMEGLKASMHLFQPKHFFMPFLAHAFGTFSGAFLTAKLASNKHVKLALGVGLLFLVGGVTNILLLPSPLWFSILDISLAYIPMAYFAGRMALK